MSIEIIATIVFLVIYIVFGIKIGILAFEFLNNISANFTLITIKNHEFIRNCASPISFAIGVSWLMVVFFFFGAKIGNTFYKKIIIKGNEEKRIASWFV